MRIARVFASLLLTVFIAPAAGAADRPTPNPLVAALGQCLEIADDRARLACTDVAARRLVEAERARAVVVVDADQVKKTRRSLFGLAIDSGDAFTGRAAPAEAIQTLDTTVVRATDQGNGRWLLQLAEGGRWRTTDPWTSGPDVRAGDAVTIAKGLLGSYTLRGKGLRTVKVLRLN